MSTKNEIEINATRAEERMECGAPETKKTSGAARRRHIDADIPMMAAARQAEE